jgi:hypothetical protein
MTNEELRDAYLLLAKRTGFSFVEIGYMARMIAQADHDPLPPEEWGEPFEFARRKLSVFDDTDDLNCINPSVPKPDAQVLLKEAWDEFKHDTVSIDRIYAMNADLSLARHWQLFVNQWDWVCFWALRHRDAETRMKFKKSLREADAAAERLAFKANYRLRERRVVMLKGNDNARR